MKNNRLMSFTAALGMGLMAALTMSCERASESEAQPMSYVKHGDISAEPCRKIFQAYGKGSCPGCGGDCIGNVVVIAHPTHRAALNTYFAGMTGKPAEVANFFNGTEWPTYFPELAKGENADCLQGLQSGTYDIIRLDSEDRCYYIAGPGVVTYDAHTVVMPVLYQ